MSFQPDMLKLEGEFDILKQQTSLTIESWDDPVQRRFYEQFIDTLPKEFIGYINSLNILNKSFEAAEKHISKLL